MKHFYTNPSRHNHIIRPTVVLIIGLLSISMAEAQEGWTIHYPPRYRNINDIVFHDAFHVSLLGGNPSNDSINFWAYSPTGGTSWDSFGDRPMQPMLKSAVFVNELLGFCAGVNETLYTTDNGGKMWYPSSFGLALNNLNINKLYITHNGGLIAAGGLDGTSGKLLYSADNGKNWTITNTWSTNEITGVAENNDHTMFVCGPGNFFRYDDFLKTLWADAEVHNQTNPADYMDVVFYGESLGFCIGGTRGADSTRVVLKTTDGGAIWNCILEEAGPRLNAVSVIDENNIVVAGDYGSILKSIDGGETWELIDFSDIPYMNFNTVEFLNTHYGAVGGDFGHFIVYHDGTPIAITNTAVNVGRNKATVKGQALCVNENCNAYFCYGTTPNTENFVSIGVIIGTDIVNLTHELGYLEENTKYYYRLKLTDGQSNEYFGDIKSFYTGNPIPNWDFELWDNTIPQSWFFEFSHLPVSEMPELPFSKNTIGHLSPTAINIQEVVQQEGNVEGEIYTDKFAVNLRHQTLEGYFTYRTDFQDTATVSVILFEGNDTIATGTAKLFQQYDYYIYDWTKFVVPIIYNSATRVPDFAKITIRSTCKNNPTDAILGVDKLSFDGDYLPVQPIKQANSYVVVPNPCQDFVKIENCGLPTPEKIEIFSVSGKLLVSKSIQDGNNLLNTKDLPAGMYIIRIYSASSPLQQYKLIKE